MEDPLDQDHGDDDEAGADGFKMEHLHDYANFAKGTLRKRWAMLLAVLVLGVALTIPVSIYWPRTFVCTTVLMPVSSGVLDSRDTPSNALAGAADLILRHENLEAIIRDIDLIRKFKTLRAPVLRLKDRIVTAVAGPMTAQAQMASLVGTLENKIEVTTEKGDLTIKVSWSDADTATELAAAARNSFVKARHTAEISAFEEKMAILDGHSDKLRQEIGVLADQLKAVRDQKLDEVKEMRSEASRAQAAKLVAEQREMVRALPVHQAVALDSLAPDLKTKLDELRTKLTAAEADHDQRLREAQSKLDELKLKLTPSHPEVIAQEQQVAALSGTPSDLALMRAEAKDLAAELRQRDGLAAGTSMGGPTGGVGSSKTALDDLLPPDVTDLLQRDNLDPGLTAQLSSTVLKYGALRDDLLTTRIELDTAQAAFNHRYQVIIPAEVPSKPDKPKPGLIIGAGLFLSVLLSVLLPIFAEWRKGVIFERWQVQHLQLPVLAELHLPPYSPD